MKDLNGGCQCQGVKYTITGEPIFAAICHCSMCRRAHAAPAVAWMMVADSQINFSADARKYYASSEQAQRGFCEYCGTQISFTASFLPGMIDIALGSLDAPEAVTPALHYWHSAHISWAEFADDLPRYPELPPFGED